ncbi:GIY-YIG nuclease family protein [Desulfoprunum benzoelyticum]|uniref:Putative endonuclease n=1 Tax=Desulfoprunum benzoelyticum TaxID=1506996 RepID=A0A840V1N5_9BACT|nr:GIY-YIG nuclease family protein [Desulfoprunum benzoelyticum]MBB5347760.1 putative endonuclease [Desulfoprunum benzoelyticum]MBM9529351.1 GIY-YIG nuclease family protein [Desulfoprunum benzoelyticum]
MQPCHTRPQTGSWFTYIVLCGDGTLYTGVTTDPARRLAEHNSAQGGARYTRSRQPVRLVFLERQPSRSAACKREHAIKDLSATAKKALIALEQDTAESLPLRLMA